MKAPPATHSPRDGRVIILVETILPQFGQPPRPRSPSGRERLRAVLHLRRFVADAHYNRFIEMLDSGEFESPWRLLAERIADMWAELRIAGNVLMFAGSVRITVNFAATHPTSESRTDGEGTMAQREKLTHKVESVSEPRPEKLGIGYAIAVMYIITFISGLLLIGAALGAAVWLTWGG